MDIFYQHDLISLYRRTTDAASCLYLYTGRFPLKRPQDQMAVLHQIESNPIDIRQRLASERRYIGQIRHKIGNTVYQTLKLNFYKTV